MIILFTDFGIKGPYVAQISGAILRHHPGVPILNLLDDVPPWNVKAGAFLLAAYRQDFPPGSVFLCVVDPGVGTAREGIVLRAFDQYFVAPDNGLLSLVQRRAAQVQAWTISYHAPTLSATFHGRDLFAPVAAMIAQDGRVPGREIDPAALAEPGFPDDLFEVIYLDAYGNALTGIRAASMDPRAVVQLGERRMENARTFAENPVGTAFWYENANGLVELAVNQGSAELLLGLRVGDSITVELPRQD
ncbi:MAG: S-adenosyl-l-methionine hydroxide adenosyltransferase family protein [Thiotrichales bacterium]